MSDYPVFFRDKIIKKEEVLINFVSPSNQYGMHVFEGVQVIYTDTKYKIFRLNKHIERLFRSANLLEINLNYNQKELTNLVKNYLSNINPKENCIIRISLIPEMGSWSTYPLDSSLIISAYSKFNKNVNDKDHLSLFIPKFKKPNICSSDHSIKVGANYILSRRGHIEAVKKGFDSCLLVNTIGEIVEAGGSNVFFINDKVLFTPRKTSNMLDGITRDTLLKSLNQFGFSLVEKKIPSTEIGSYDSAFLCGTSIAIKPISKINNINFDINNENILLIKDIYQNIIYGNYDMPSNWYSEVK